MEEEFVPYEQALELKELGFDELCFGYYQKSAVIGNDNILPISFINKAYNFNDDEYSKLGVPFCSAPTYSQAFRWFKEKYGIFVSIVPNKYGSLDSFIGWIYMPLNGSTKDIDVGGRKGFNTPEEAELECLKKLIQIVKIQIKNEIIS